MPSMIQMRRPDGGYTPAYLAQASQPQAPGLILIQEWWGLNDDIRAIAERFAAAGFTTVAPDLYRGRCTTQRDEAAHLKQSLDFADATQQDLAAALQYLAPRKVAALGFCMGGALALAAAAHLPGLAAAVCFYGLPPPELAQAPAMRAPVQAHFALQDAWITPARAAQWQAQMQAAGHAADCHYYDADHGFFNATQAEVFEPAAAARAWQRSLDFLGLHLA